MASFEPLKNGRVRASVAVNGIRKSLTLPNLSKAKSWAREKEVELSGLEGVADSSLTFGDLFEVYSEKVSSTKRGSRWEQIRLAMLQKKYPVLCKIKLIDSKREDLEDWITLRSKNVKTSTVNRELNLISHALTSARRWRWMSHCPMQDLERPKNPASRFRPISDEEITEICCVLGFKEGEAPVVGREFVGVAFLFAIETAMRAGEICSLTPSNINYDTGVAKLEKTKNGDSREVPLSDRAMELLRMLPLPESEYDAKGNENTMFQMSSGTLSTTFRKYRLQTRIEDLTFHDTRHEAITRLADKFTVLELAAITGHRNINQLLTYYNKTASELSSKLRVDKPEDAKANNAAIDYGEMAQQLLQQLVKAGGLSVQGSA